MRGIGTRAVYDQRSTVLPTARNNSPKEPKSSVTSSGGRQLIPIFDTPRKGLAPRHAYAAQHLVAEAGSLLFLVEANVANIAVQFLPAASKASARLRTTNK